MACKTECNCVQRIIKLDPNLTQKRESLFVSSEAQAIIEQLTGVSSNGKIIAKVERATPVQESAASPVKQDGPEEKTQTPEDVKQSSETGRAKSAKTKEVKGKSSVADVAKRAKHVSTPKLYQNDRTARAVRKWRAFRTNFENENQQHDHLEEDESKDKPSTEDAGEIDKDVQPDSLEEEADKPEVAEARGDSVQGDSVRGDDVDEELSPRSRPTTASRGGPVGSKPINRPAGARFGRRYSMPVALISGLPHSPPKVSPRYNSPGASRESSPPRSPSPARHSHWSAGITHLHTNREKLSTLFNERSAIISSLDKQKAQKDMRDVKLMTQRLGRRASDSNTSLQQFRQRNNTAEVTRGRLLQRRTSLSTAHIDRATADPEDSSATAVGLLSHSSGSLLSSSVKGTGRATKSKSCENVAEQRFRHVPCPPRDRRRGSVCVGQIARAREMPGAPVSQREPGENQANSDPMPFNQEAKLDNDERNHGKTQSLIDCENHQKAGDVRRQCGQFIYYNQRRGSLSMVQGKEYITDKLSPRELTEKPTNPCPDAAANGTETEYRKKERFEVPAQKLTLENVLTHTALTGNSQVNDERSLPAISPRGIAVDIEHPPDSPPSTSRPAPTKKIKRGDSADSPSTSVTTSPPHQHPSREPTPFALPADTTFEHYALQRRRSLFLRTESEIIEDVEQEIQEQVARRKRQLQATRCVSAKGARRLQSRALAQSAAGRLKRNLREVTRQRTTKELILMDGERRRLWREAPVTH